ncbi:substrate-binding domain-containing protein [Anaerocolumna jejuensis]|uniref:substrate-binding domain-containing protein n=1 Tax=Anaerocolumna jejuensis TaxID=259063 RepID=UPI003F7B50F7
MKLHMDRKKILMAAVLANLAVLSVTFWFFTSATDFSAGLKEKRIKIGVCFMTMDSTYFEMLNNEIGSVIEEHGDLLITRDPGGSQERQNKQIEELVEKGVRAIFVTPVDWRGVEPALKKARSEGVRIIVVDSQVYDKDLADCTVTSDNFDAGVQIAKYFMTQVKSAKIVLLKQPEVKSSMDRINGFKSALKEYGRYTIAAELEYGGDEETAFKAVQELLDSGIGFDAVFATNDAGAFGSCGALEKQPPIRTVDLMGVNGSPVGKAMIKKKQMMVTAAQFPIDMGEKAAESMYALLGGKDCPKEIYIPVKLITKYTIESYDTDKWQ